MPGGVVIEERKVPHICNPRCTVEWHCDIIEEYGFRHSLDTVITCLESIGMIINTIKRTEEYPIASADGTLLAGAWLITYNWRGTLP